MAISYNSPLFIVPPARGVVDEFASMTDELVSKKRRDAFGPDLNRSLKMRAKGITMIHDAKSAPLLERNHVAIRDNYLMISTIGISGSADIYGCHCVSSDGQIDVLLASHAFGSPLFLAEVIDAVERYWKILNPELISDKGTLLVHSSKFDFGQIFFPSTNSATLFLNAVGMMASNPNLHGVDTYGKKTVVNALFAILSLSSSSPFFSHCVSVSGLISRLYILSDLQVEDGGVSSTNYYSLSYLAKNIFDAEIASEVLSVSRESHIGSWADEKIEEMETNAINNAKYQQILEYKKSYDLSLMGGRSDEIRANIYRTIRYVDELISYLIGQLAKMEVSDVARLSIYRYESSMIRREIDRIETGTKYSEAVMVKMLSDYQDNMERYLIANEPFYLEVGIASNEVVFGELSIGSDVRLAYEGESKMRQGDRLSLMDSSFEIVGSVEIDQVGSSWLGISMSGAMKSSLAEGFYYLIPVISTWSDMSYMLRGVSDKEEAPAVAFGVDASGGSPLVEEVFDKLDRNDVVLVNSPPGGGKTTLLIEIANLASLSAKSVIIATATVAQGLEIASRFSAKGIPSTFITRANANENSYPQIDNVSYQSKVEGIEPGSIVIATVAKLQLSRGEGAQADLLLVDEAYQSTYGDIYIICQIGDKMVLVGDPGQLEPVVSIDITKMNIMKNPVVYSSPYGFEIENDATVRINASYRLPKSTVDIVQPLFYPDLLFKSKQVDGMAFELLDTGAQLDDSRETLFRQISKDKSLIFADNFFSPVARNEIASRIGEAVSFISYLVTSEHHYTDKNDSGSSIRRIEASDIAVITPSRKMVGQLKSLLAKEGLADVEVETVERWQGKEKLISVIFILPDEISNGPTASSYKRQSVMYSRHKLAAFTFGSVPDNFFIS